MNGVTSDRLVVLTRYPQPGRVKTRLIPLLGADGAAELHRQMTCHTLAVAAELRRLTPELDVVVRVDGGTPSLMRRLYGSDWVFEEQGDGDLGTRIDRAVCAAFADGRSRVAVIGTDCPDLTSQSLRSAFFSLGAADVVIGPACDGGYYLIGLRRMASNLFVRMPWGSSEVFGMTVEAARQLALAVTVLPLLRDVDRPEDIAVWEQASSVSRSCSTA